jgi:hypothetical protein
MPPAEERITSLAPVDSGSRRGAEVEYIKKLAAQWPCGRAGRSISRGIFRLANRQSCRNWRRS